MGQNSFYDKDHGWNKLYTQFKAGAEEGEAKVFVGFLRSSGQYPAEEGKSPITVAQVAAIHEFGSKDGTIPERSFMRSALDANGERIKKLTEKLALKVLDGDSTVEKALGVLGEFVKGLMQKKIRQGPFTPLKASTIRHKGGKTKPLIDTGQLINSIDWEVQKGKK